MEREEALARLDEIQRIAERTTLYTMLPGLPAVIGGGLALAGCAASFAMIRSLDFKALLDLPSGTQIGFCVMWTLLGGVAILQDVVLTSRAARRAGAVPLSRPGRFAALSLSPSVLVAVVLTVQFLLDLQIQYVAPAWMMCYGTGVYAAGLFSVRLPRLLGLAFVLAGAAGLLLLADYGVALVAASFGGLHVLFGLEIMRRSGRGPTA
ncbi:MAG: hypothetical protein MUC63_06540 [Planctomycetes bacterium]|jgi:hypothetical protein|nr:hypothetical protein [Planctomycetota bacterium]